MDLNASTDGQRALNFEIETRPIWIRKDQYPYTGIIRDVTPVKGKYGTDYRLTFTDGLSFDLWGGNLNYMVNVFGKRAETWLNRTVKIVQNDQKQRVISEV